MGCTRTPIAMPSYKGMPAAWRLCTARRVNMLPQTCTMALCSLDLSLISTPRTESCSPAPDTFSRSSLFAEDRTATRSALGKPAASASTTAAGTASFSTVARTACAAASTSEPPLRALSKAATAESKSEPFTTAFMTPKGIARPLGALKPSCCASFSSLPLEAALLPATWGLSAMDTASRTLLSAKLSSPSFGFTAVPEASFFDPLAWA
mmetsp:Transcript_35246/g.84495  ORF Transcript_35246/g.84495 Transcript_35246/m.84495 type:complete len:209 (-) Transcript_35246:2002-2628(-)